MHTAPPGRDDRLGELAPDRCACGPAGHRLLGEVASAGAEGLCESDRRTTAAQRAALHDAGLVDALEAADNGWTRGMWLLRLTPAGRHHLAAVTGRPGHHLGPGGCGAEVGVDGSCGGCGAEIALTSGEARRRIEAMAPGPARDAEVWASRFSCDTHGRARAAMVSTAKICTRCGAGLNRLLDSVLDRPR